MEKDKITLFEKKVLNTLEKYLFFLLKEIQPFLLDRYILWNYGEFKYISFHTCVYCLPIGYSIKNVSF